MADQPNTSGVISCENQKPAVAVRGQDNTTANNNTMEMDKTPSSSKFVELISMFEAEESSLRQKSFTKKRLLFEDTLESDNDTTSAGTAKSGSRSDDEEAEEGSAQTKGIDDGEKVCQPPAGGCGVAVNLSRLKQRDRGSANLLVVIHPWCMFGKSQMSRNAEFPPPGFLEQLKAKFLALQAEHHRQSTSAKENSNRRRRKWCVQYAFRGSLCTEKIKLLNQQANLLVNNDSSKTL